MIRSCSPLCIALLFVTYAGAALQQCPPTDPLDSTVHLPHPDDCNQFYRCDHGIAKPERCPAGLHFNAVLQVCDWPYAANCQAGSSSAVQTSPTIVLSTEETEVVVSTTTSSEWSSSTSANPTITSTTESTLYPPCPPIDEAGVIIRFPHETNCKYYYICNNGYSTVYQCRTGYLFSPTQLKCKPNSESECGIYSTSHSSTASTPAVTTAFEETSTGLGETTSSATSSPLQTSTHETVPSTSAVINTTHETTLTAEATTEEVTTSETSNTTQISVCPGEDDPNNIIRIPHESVCYYYYLCRNGYPILYQCPNNLHFNPTLKVCQDKDEASCEQSSSTTFWVTEITTTDHTEATEENSSEETLAVTTPNTESTSEENAETTEIQNTTEQSSESATVNSPEGTTGSEITSEDTLGTTVELPSACPPVDDPNVIIRIPHESVCFYYYICQSGELVLYQCPEGLHFNSSVRICQEKDLAGCTLSVSSTTSLTDVTEDLPTTEEIDETTFNPETTGGFAETTGGDSSEITTEETTIDIGQTTAEEALTTSEELVETTVNPEITENVAETTLEDSSEVNTEETTFDIEITTEENTVTTTVDQSFSCPTVDDPNIIIRIPHKSVCHYYYICKNGVPVLYQCPEGLHFNATTRICQEKELAGCVQSTTTLVTVVTEDGTTPEEIVETSETPETTDGLTETTSGHISEHTTEGTTFDIENTTEGNSGSSENQVTTDDDLNSVTTEPIDLSTEYTTESETETTAIDQPSTCPPVDNPDFVIRIPHESVCHYYYICKNGAPVLYQCPEGQNFNSTVRICQEKELAGCEQLSTTTSTTEVTEDGTTTQETGGTSNNPETTDGVTEITSEDTSEETTLQSTTGDIEHTTESTDSHVSVTTEDIDSTTEIHTTIDIPLTCSAVDVSSVIVRIPHECVCEYYYICKNGELVLSQCSDGLHFNPMVRICQEKELAGCETLVPSTTSMTENTE